MVPEALFCLCTTSVVSLDKDAVFVDGWNSFNPYACSRITKSLGAEPGKVLSRIHVARAFTEYQLDAIICRLQDAIEQWNPAMLAISYLPSLFSGSDGKRLFEPLIEHLKSLTNSSGIVTIVTSFGGSWYGDRLLASKADRVIRIEQPSKKLIRIFDDGYVTDYMPVPPGQTRLTEFTDSVDFNFARGNAYGQNSAVLSHVA